MLWLVQPELGSAWKRDGSHEAETGFGDWAAELYASGSEVGDCGFDVVAHQVELGVSSLFGWMDAQLGGREGEDEPAVAGVNGGKFEDVAKEGADFFGVVGVEEGVRAGDHRCTLFAASDWVVGRCAADGDPAQLGEFFQSGFASEAAVAAIFHAAERHLRLVVNG